MKNILFLFTIVFVFLFCTSCKKNLPPNVLPPVTQTGANTFGCKINGQVWVPYFKCSAFTSPCSEIQTDFMHPNTNAFLPLSFQFGVERSNKVINEGSFVIATRSFGQTFASTISQPGNVFDSLYIGCIFNNFSYDNVGFPGQSQVTGNNFTITKLDTINRIISGTFNFKFIEYPDSIIVTDGRFDFKIDDYCKCSH